MLRVSLGLLFLFISLQINAQSTIVLDSLRLDTLNTTEDNYFFTLPYDIADANSANRYYSDANYHYQKGNLVYASTLMKSAIKKQPNRYNYHHLQAYILMELGDHKNAVRHAERAVALHPDDWKMLYCLALTKYAAKDFLGATIEYSRGIEIDPSAFLLYEGRAHAKAQMNDQLGALNDFNLTIMLKPTYVKAYYGRGMTNFKLNKYQEALTDFNSVLLREPENASALYYRGASRKMLGDVINACADFEKAARLGMSVAASELKSNCSR